MASEKGVESARHGIVMRLKRVEGQLRGVQGMVEQGQDCEAVAVQLSAARKALDRAFYELMACAIQHPQFSAKPKEASAARVARLTKVLAKLG